MSEAVTPRPDSKKKAVPARSSKGSLIDVRHLVKVYAGGGQEEVKAVNDVSFSVSEGEFFGFLGPNGAGKTTVIRIITTLLAKTSGSIRVAGMDVERDGAEIRRIIGYTGQSIGVDGELTGRENLWLIGRLYHMPKSLVEERVEELLDVLQLKDAADRRAYTGPRSANAERGVGVPAPPTQGGENDDLPHDSVHGRGGSAVPAHRDHRSRQDRGRGESHGAEGRDRC